MATRVAAAGGGDWNTGASWVGGVAPTAADDAQVPVTAGNMVIGTGAVCRSADFNTYTGQLSGTGTLTIGDGTAGLSNIALRLASGMTRSGSWALSFISSSSTTQTVTSNGITCPGNVTFNNASGKWQVVDNLTCGGNFVVTAANTLDTTTSSAQIIMSGSVFTFSGGSKTFYQLTATAITGNVVYGGNNSFTNVSLTAGSGKSGNVSLSGNMTVTGTLAFAGGSSVNRLLILNSTVGTARTITTTGATVTATNTDFQDITLSVAKDFSAQTDVGDCGGNSGITFPASVSQTWSGTSGGNWSTNGWTTRVPLPQDDVVINNAFSASQTVTADMPRLGRSIDWTGATGSPTWTNNTTNDIFGSLTLISAMSVTAGSSFTYRGRSNYTITSAGVSFANVCAINCPGGTYTLNDALTSTSASGFFLNGGGLNSNGFNVTFKLFVLSNSVTRSLTMGTSTWTATDSGATTPWSLATTTGLTFSGSSSTIIYSIASASTRTFAGGGLTYGTLTYTVAGSTGELDITGANSFAAINFSDVTNARSLKFTAGTTTTIRNGNGFNVQGTSGKLMTVDSITAATHTITATLDQHCQYLSVKNSVVDASPKWYAGTTSTDVSGNTNWLFSNPSFYLTSGTSRDYERQFFQGLVGNIGTLEDMKNKWFCSQTGLSHPRSAERQYLKSLGATGKDYHELWFTYLGNKGFSGSLNDRRRNFFTTQTTFI